MPFGNPAGYAGSLSSVDIADLGERRRQADARLGEALAINDAGAKRVEADHQLAVQRLLGGFREARNEGMDRLGDGGKARQPRFAGQFLRGLRDKQAQGQADLERGKSDQLAQLVAALDAVRREHGEELSVIDAETARRRTALESLLGNVGAA